jgi:LysM repeat protein
MTPSPTALPPPVSPSPTVAEEVGVMVEDATPTFTPGPPTIPPSPTPTLGPYEYTVQSGDTLLYIIQQFGYRDFSVVPEVVALNDNIPNPDSLPGAGAVILIPRQTATPTPEGLELTPTSFLNVAIAPTNEQTGLSVETGSLDHVVQEGQTIVDIAAIHGITLEVVARLNPDVAFFGCNFEIPSGGPNCNPLVRVGQVLRVPAPTPTPTLSPTPSGSETPTPTPTYAPPHVVSPPQDAVVPAGVFRLEWVGVGVLQPDEVYLVQVTDTITGQTHFEITRSTSVMLPESMIPTDGQRHVINWTVAVARPNEEGRYRIISGAPQIRTFQWESR